MILLTAISRVFDPFLVFTMTIFVGIVRLGIPITQLGIFFLFLFFWLLFIPISFLAFAVKKRLVASWDIGNLKERRPVLGLLLIHLFISLLVIRFIAPPPLYGLFILFFLWLVGFFLITLFWKISGHSGAISVFCGLVLYWYGVSYWPILILVPIVGIARVLRGDHTLAQVIAGAVYSWVLLTLGIIFHII